MEPQVQQGQEETRESAVLSRLKTIRIGKAKILNMLAALKKKDDGGEPVDRELIEKLVSSFDALKAQEEEFLTVAKKIVGEKEEDYAKAEAAGEDSSESEGDLLADEVLKTIAEGETAMNVNDDLLNQLRQKKQKKSALRKELEKETAEKMGEVNRALEQLEFAKLKLAGERSSVDRKQQQLERLRREAVKRGYVLQNNAGGSLTSSAESPVATTGGSSNRKAKPAANEEPLPELPGGLRVPPVPSVPGVPTDGEASEQTAEGAQFGDKPADLHAHLQQRFAAIAARKERMIQLRSRLNDAQETRTMDTTYSTAMQRLQNLTSMREHLEQLQSSGQPVTEDTLNSIGHAMDNIGQAVSATSDAAPTNGSTPDDVESSENDGSRRPSTVLNETQSEPILRRTTDDGDDDGELEHDQDSTERKSQSSTNEHSADAYCTDLEKAEVAKRHLGSGHATLEKKRTLERIRSFTTGKATATGHASEGGLTPGSNLLEKDICLIMDKAVLPWLAQHELDKMDGGLVDELRSLVLDQSRSMCFPSGYATDLFEKQLTTILDGTLAQYVGSPLSPQKEQLISDLSEILYNELAFFKLMHNSNLVVEKEE